jgi:hypothetical protein
VCVRASARLTGVELSDQGKHFLKQTNRTV